VIGPNRAADFKRHVSEVFLMVFMGPRCKPAKTVPS
jgi:hypothetical protein